MAPWQRPRRTRRRSGAPFSAHQKVHPQPWGLRCPLSGLSLDTLFGRLDMNSGRSAKVLGNWASRILDGVSSNSDVRSFASAALGFRTPALKREQRDPPNVLRRAPTLRGRAMPIYKGECFCGAVKIEATGEPE